MTTAIIPTEPTALSTVVYQLDRNPALVYLAGLSTSSRRPMIQSLNLVANLVIPGSDYLSFAWHQLRYQHTTAIRTRLADNHPPATANRHLAALRGVLKECWRLGFTTAEDYQRACDIKSVKEPRPRQRKKGGTLRPVNLPPCSMPATMAPRPGCAMRLSSPWAIWRVYAALSWLP